MQRTGQNPLAITTARQALNRHRWLSHPRRAPASLACSSHYPAPLSRPGRRPLPSRASPTIVVTVQVTVVGRRWLLDPAATLPTRPRYFGPSDLQSSHFGPRSEAKTQQEAMGFKAHFGPLPGLVWCTASEFVAYIRLAVAVNSSDFKTGEFTY